MFEKCCECEKESVHFCREDDLLRAVEQFRDSILEVKQNPEISSKYHKHVIMHHPAKLFYHLVAIYIVCYEMGASADLFNTYQYLHI